MNNKTCPYTCLPISKVVASREHIVPDALGGPNGFALKADRDRNSRYGDTVDARLIQSTLMGQAAADANVMTRTGPAEWSALGKHRCTASMFHDSIHRTLWRKATTA